MMKSLMALKEDPAINYSLVLETSLGEGQQDRLTGPASTKIIIPQRIVSRTTEITVNNRPRTSIKPAHTCRFNFIINPPPLFHSTLLKIKYSNFGRRLGRPTVRMKATAGKRKAISGVPHSDIFCDLWYPGAFARHVGREILIDRAGRVASSYDAPHSNRSSGWL
jgi:hypothetical protein